MSYADFQHAATIIIRTPQVVDTLDTFLADFDLTDSERKNLAFLTEDTFATTYTKNMQLIRHRMAGYGIPLTKQILGEERFKGIYLDLFEPQSLGVQNYHLSHAFCTFLLETDTGREACRDAPSYFEDVVRFERAQAFLRAYVTPDAAPLAKHTLLKNKNLQLLKLTFDIPQLMRNLSKETKPDFQHLQVTRRPHFLLMVKGKHPKHVPAYEVDEETYRFLNEQLQADPQPLPLPASYEDLKQLGIFREIRASKKMANPNDSKNAAIYNLYNPNGKVWEQAFTPDQSDEILKHFQQFGFVKIKQFYDLNMIEKLRANLLRYQLEIAPTVGDRDHFAIKDRPGSYGQLSRLDFYDPFFEKFREHVKIKNLVSMLLEGDTASCPLQFFNIVPGFNPPTPPHQDAFNHRLPDGKMVNVWIPLAATNATNGCLHYIPGSHLGPRSHDTEGVVHVVSEWTEEDRMRDVRLFAEPGDILIHHGFTIHMSEHNRSPEERWALGMPYIKCQQSPRKG